MNSVALIRIAAQSIRKNKMRTMLTMLGIIIGVAAVIVMVAVGQGARSTIRAQIDNLGSNMIIVTPGATTQGGVSQGAGEIANLTLEDVERLERESVMLSAISPVIVTRTQIIGGEGNWRTMVNGVDADYQEIRDWETVDGSFFSAEDVRSMRRVVVIGSTIAENLFPYGGAVGERIHVRNVPFEVIGVLAEKGQATTGSDQDDVLLVPYTTAQARLSGWMRIPQILASAHSPEEIGAAQDEMRAILRESRGLDGAADDFTVRNQTDLAQAAEGSTEIMTMLLAAIASISLLVGGIGIMNIMLVSVTERTREIGIRMAVGARGSDVLTQFLVESLVMGLIGGFLGLAFGYAGSELLGHLTGWNTVVAPAMMVVAVTFSAGVGVFFGFYPARKAAALHPIQALRFE